MPRRYIASEEVCVYLADDDDDDSYFFEVALRKFFPTCLFHHFADGSELLASLEGALHTLPTLIFLDILMPLLSGPATHRVLQANADWATIPTGFLTSFSDLEYIAQKHNIDLISLYTKPNTIEGLEVILSKYLSNKQP